MTVADISRKCSEKLENAAFQWAVRGDPQPILNIIDQIQKESFLEGYNHAIEVLQDTLDETT